MFSLTAAVLALAAGTAFAADPGARPVAVDYVRVCDQHGTGFFYIPGSDTCLRLSGYVRLDATLAEPAFWDEQLPDRLRFKPSRSYNYFSTLARGRLEFDARTMTEYGQLRSFIQVQTTIGLRPTSTLVIGSGNGGTDPSGTVISGDRVDLTELRQGYIQFGGLTAGRAYSFFNLPYFATFHSPLTADGFANLLAYTFQSGRFAATISVEDTIFHRTNIGTLRFVPPPGAIGVYGGQTLPDLVGAATYTDDWGSLKLSGALHHVRPSDSFFDDELGFAVQFGGEIFLPTSGAPGQRDRLYGGVVYTHGATQYSGLAADEDRFGASAGFDQFDAGALIGFPPGFSIRNFGFTLTDVVSGHVGGLHYWSPKWRSAASVSYADLSDAYFGFAKGDIKQMRALANLIWTPAPQMQIGFEAVYDRTDFDSNITRPFRQATGRPVVSDFDRWQGVLRFQRNF